MSLATLQSLRYRRYLPCRLGNTSSKSSPQCTMSAQARSAGWLELGAFLERITHTGQ
jgi:hypothetical protein